MGDPIVEQVAAAMIRADERWMTKREITATAVEVVALVGEHYQAENARLQRQLDRIEKLARSGPGFAEPWSAAIFRILSDNAVGIAREASR